MNIQIVRVLTVCLGVVGLSAAASGAAASDPSDLDRVKAANQAYYAALSARDISAMERVWARGPQDVNVAPPVRPAAYVGWDAIRNTYQRFWATLDELSISMPEPSIRIHGTVAWVCGIEQAKRKTKKGEVGGGPNFGTSIFIKEGERWLMVFHQAALIPEPR